MNYQQVSKTYMIHPETFEFLPLSKVVGNDILAVPFFFWRLGYGNKVLVNRPGVEGKIIKIKTLTLDFNGWSIHFDSELQLNSINRAYVMDNSYRNVDVTYTDKKTGKPVSIRVSCYTHIADRTYNGYTTRDVVGVDYRVTVNGQEKEFMTKMDNLRETVAFRSIADLDTTDFNSHDGMNDKLLYGVRITPYSIVYQGKHLNGTSMALMCGPWAVLMGDKLEYDSIVALDCASSAVLGVDRFIHTVNPYVLKVMMLQR